MTTPATLSLTLFHESCLLRYDPGRLRGASTDFEARWMYTTCSYKDNVTHMSVNVENTLISMICELTHALNEALTAIRYAGHAYMVRTKTL